MGDVDLTFKMVTSRDLAPPSRAPYVANAFGEYEVSFSSVGVLT